MQAALSEGSWSFKGGRNAVDSAALLRPDCVLFFLTPPLSPTQMFADLPATLVLDPDLVNRGEYIDHGTFGDIYHGSVYPSVTATVRAGGEGVGLMHDCKIAGMVAWEAWDYISVQLYTCVCAVVVYVVVMNLVGCKNAILFFSLPG